MTTYDSPGALVRTFIDLLVANQPDAACAMVSDDCEYDNVPMGKVFGPSEISGSLAPFLGGCTAIEWIIHRQVESGTVANGTVFNERTDRFQLGGRWVEVPVCGIFEVRDGKITLWRDYFDQSTFRDQLTPSA